MTSRNFWLDEETTELLEEHDEDNHSEIVRDLLQAYYAPGCFDAPEAAVRVQEARLEAEIEATEAELDALQAERETLAETKQAISRAENQKLAEAVDLLVDPDGPPPIPGNQAVEHQADKAGLSTEELLDEVRAEQQRRREARDARRGEATNGD